MLGRMLTRRLSLGSPSASLRHFLTGKTGWQLLLPGPMWGPRRRCGEGAWFSNTCSPTLCRPTSATILPEDAEHPKLPTLPGPGGSHSWGAGTGDGSALPSPGSCGMRTGMRVGSCPSPGSPTPALPLMPGIFSWGGWCAPQAISACPPGLGSGAASSRKPSGTPSLKCGPISTPHFSCGSSQPQTSPLHTYHCEFLEAEATSDPNLPGCLGPGQGPVHCGLQPFLEGIEHLLAHVLPAAPRAGGEAAIFPEG